MASRFQRSHRAHRYRGSHQVCDVSSACVANEPSPSSSSPDSSPQPEPNETPSGEFQPLLLHVANGLSAAVNPRWE